jgi:hypothetical protein
LGTSLIPNRGFAGLSRSSIGMSVRDRTSLQN